MVKFNKNEFKWLLILIGLTYYIYNLISSGKIYYFIHPRMVKYVQIALIFLIILILLQFRRIFIISYNRKISFAIFSIPILLGIFVNPQDLSGEVAAKKGTTLLQNSISKFTISSTYKTTNTNVSVTPSEDTKQVTKTAQNNELKKNISLKQADTEKNTLIINDSNFKNITEDITNSDPNKYKGKKVTITGFVFRDDTTSKNEFVTARLVIICCAADAGVDGLFCQLDKASNYKDDTWITVTGILDTEKKLYGGEEQMVPVVRVDKIEVIQKPQNPYIYANF